MVAEPPTASPAATSISLVPRQVLLAMGAAPASSLENKDRGAKNKNKNKKSKKEGGDPPIVDPGERLGLMEEGRVYLLRSIASFLDSNGFSRTLAVFRSEAHLEKDDTEEKSVNLEDILCRFLELSRTSNTDKDYEGKNVSEKGNESGIAEDAKAYLGAADVHGDEVLPGVKKKKRKSRSTSDTAQPNLEVSKENVADTSIKNHLKEASEGSKAKKKKKTESSSAFHTKSEQIDSEKLREFIEEKVVDLKSVIQNNVCQLDESGQKSKTKKKKHAPDLSTTSAKLVGSEASKVDVGPQEHDNMDIPAAQTAPVESVPNGKKKEKKRSATGIADKMDGGLVLQTKSESPCGKQLGNVSTMEETTQALSKKNDLAGNLSINLVSETMDKKKKKKKSTTGSADQMDGGLVVEAKEGGSTPDNQMGKAPSMDKATDGAKSRKSNRKKHAIEGESQLDDLLTVQALEENGKNSDRNKGKELQKLGASVSCKEESSYMNKKQKTQSIQEDIKLEETIVDDKKVHDHSESNGSSVKNGSNIPTSVNAKEIMKQSSSEPKTAKAFQRVKIDDVTFADERLKDNSYWGKSGADSGYGAKAQDVLGQVKGRDFRHEKTKKKRGSYRGGQIDLGSHSIKFNYSDGE